MKKFCITAFDDQKKHYSHNYDSLYEATQHYWELCQSERLLSVSLYQTAGDGASMEPLRRKKACLGK